MPTATEIEAARTPRGGWTRETLARWGISWPPPKGWRKLLLIESSPADIAWARYQRLVQDALANPQLYADRGHSQAMIVAYEEFKAAFLASEKA